jgi:hypothetical protein
MVGRWSRTIFLGSFVAMLAACSAARSASFDDARIAEEINGTIHKDHIDEVTVSVKNGRVTLRGIVDSSEQSDQARRDSERVDGVGAVSNQIRVRTRSSNFRSDVAALRSAPVRGLCADARAMFRVGYVTF